jgi:hypothetical protein
MTTVKDLAKLAVARGVDRFTLRLEDDNTVTVIVDGAEVLKGLDLEQLRATIPKKE